MEVLFLCGMYPIAYKDLILKNSKKGYQFAAQNLQEALVDGFIKNRIELSIITVPFLSTYPFGYKKPFINFPTTKYDEQVDIECASFLNIPFFTDFRNTAKNSVFNWCNSRKHRTKHIIAYSLSSRLMKYAIQAKNLYNDVIITVIIPDLPEFMGSNKLYNILGLRKRDINYIYSNIHNFDNFILISEAMIYPLGLENKKYAIVEGIFNSNHGVIKEYEFEKGTKTILYTGALSQKYGIETLLKEFSSIPNTDYRLIICGDGEARELVIKFANYDKRILYMGKVSHDLILTLQQKATLLVNPRTPDGEYTKFSFPSKTMEYFASGTPVLMYKLPGIPEEYFNHCFTLDNFSNGSLANRMTQILSMSSIERNEIGNNAKKFIMDYKTTITQVKKIIDLIK
jgi:glycosyltransferase involved in cell wall biosynthesis